MCQVNSQSATFPSVQESPACVFAKTNRDTYKVKGPLRLIKTVRLAVSGLVRNWIKTVPPLEEMPSINILTACCGESDFFDELITSKATGGFYEINSWRTLPLCLKSSQAVHCSHVFFLLFGFDRITLRWDFFNCEYFKVWMDIKEGKRKRLQLTNQLKSKVVILINQFLHSILHLQKKNADGK